MECFLGDDYILAGLPCENYVAPVYGVEPCMYQPSAVTMLFNGGSCEQSDNIRILTFSPAMISMVALQQTPGEKVHIRVTDNDGIGPVLFDGDVAVGDAESADMAIHYIHCARMEKHSETTSGSL